MESAPLNSGVFLFALFYVVSCILYGSLAVKNETAINSLESLSGPLDASSLPVNKRLVSASEGDGVSIHSSSALNVSQEDHNVQTTITTRVHDDTHLTLQKEQQTEKNSVQIADSHLPVAHPVEEHQSTNLALNASAGKIGVIPTSTGQMASRVSSPTAAIHNKKTKPGITFDEDDLPRDAEGKAILTKEDLAGSGPAFDFVVPLVIAMLSIPFVAVFGAFLYKKGRDFWERRHYRRMDFLIDGMYND